MIVKGNPQKSKLINHAIQFNGPMYQVCLLTFALSQTFSFQTKIFNSDEISILVRWILSLEPSPVNEMISLILKRRKLAEEIPSDINLKLPDGTQKSLKDLFHGKPNDLLAAFRASKWTIPQVHSS